LSEFVAVDDESLKLSYFPA